MMLRIGVLFFLLCGAHIAAGQSVIPLYGKGRIPNSVKSSVQERYLADSSVASAVTKPTLTVYLPERSRANGIAVVICPGGGYRNLMIRREGHKVAEEFNKIGVAAFVLKYRLPDDKTMNDKSIGPLQDAQQAIKLVREKAKEWNIDPQKVGIMGFSAGGHLASSAGTHFNEKLIKNRSHISLRPDFMILVYPVISFTDSLAHTGSRNNLLGTPASADQVLRFSNELQITPLTPPALLLHAGDDRVVMVQNSLRFYEQLHKNGVMAGLHIYSKGGHGFLKEPAFDEWFGSCKAWLEKLYQQP